MEQVNLFVKEWAIEDFYISGEGYNERAIRCTRSFFNNVFLPQAQKLTGVKCEWFVLPPGWQEHIFFAGLPFLDWSFTAKF